MLGLVVPSLAEYDMASSTPADIHSCLLTLMLNLDYLPTPIRQENKDISLRCYVISLLIRVYNHNTIFTSSTGVLT